MPDGNDGAEAGPSRLPARDGELEPRSSVSSRSGYHPLRQFSFPWAAQPEIVRAHQKDTYYRDLFVEQLKDVIRSVAGVRTLHAHSELIGIAGGVAYFALCALNGAQTLGEEYVNAMMVDGRTGRIAHGKVRSWLLIQAVCRILTDHLLFNANSAARHSSWHMHCFRTLSPEPTAARGATWFVHHSYVHKLSNGYGYARAPCSPLPSEARPKAKRKFLCARGCPWWTG